MKLDIQTLAFVLSLTYVNQVIALFVQYRMNRTYRGIGWWLLGSTLMAIGVILMPMLTVKSLEILVRLANPLVVLGQIFLYLGIMHFLNEKRNGFILSLIFLAFNLSYYYYMFVVNDISSRTVVITAVLAIISLMTAYKLFFTKNRRISESKNFTAAVFLANGVFMIIRFLGTLMLPPVHSYFDHPLSLTASFIVPLITSTLWTFGIIIMVNQCLNEENREEKEKLQLVFNTSPDAAMITRLNDGIFVDVNDGFLVLTGYTRDEVIGDFALKIDVWHNSEERGIFIDELNANGVCTNLEFNFRRKDGSKFIGTISARIITIRDVPHVVSVIHDITERKFSEQKIQELFQQLETEKNTAQLNSITDSLTGLANRRYFDQVLSTEFFRLKRFGSILSLIMIDVDYFKKFNDSYGHLAGDNCMREVGTALKNIVGRASDIVARYGGEEFVVILPETEDKGAELLAERIRKAVEDLAIPHSASETAQYVTVSIGVVSVYTTLLESPEQVVKLADEALYCAKKGGRNRIAVAQQRSCQF